MSGLQARIAAILGQHVKDQLTNYDADDGRRECGCGKQGSTDWNTHLADALIAALGLLSNISINGERQTWKQLYEREHTRRLELEECQILLADLSRNEHGRHQGDGDSYDPTGISQGNPHLNSGDVIGYSIHGTHKYVVPEPQRRRDPKAWRVSTSESTGAGKADQ